MGRAERGWGEEGSSGAWTGCAQDMDGSGWPGCGGISLPDPGARDRGPRVRWVCGERRCLGGEGEGRTGLTCRLLHHNQNRRGEGRVGTWWGWGMVVGCGGCGVCDGGGGLAGALRTDLCPSHSIGPAAVTTVLH